MIELKQSVHAARCTGPSVHKKVRRYVLRYRGLVHTDTFYWRRHETILRQKSDGLPLLLESADTPGRAVRPGVQGDCAGRDEQRPGGI